MAGQRDTLDVGSRSNKNDLTEARIQEKLDEGFLDEIPKAPGVGQSPFEADFLRSIQELMKSAAIAEQDTSDARDAPGSAIDTNAIALQLKDLNDRFEAKNEGLSQKVAELQATLTSVKQQQDRDNNSQDASGLSSRMAAQIQPINDQLASLENRINALPVAAQTTELSAKVGNLESRQFSFLIFLVIAMFTILGAVLVGAFLFPAELIAILSRIATSP